MKGQSACFGDEDVACQCIAAYSQKAAAAAAQVRLQPRLFCAADRHAGSFQPTSTPLRQITGLVFVYSRHVKSVVVAAAEVSCMWVEVVKRPNICSRGVEILHDPVVIRNYHSSCVLHLSRRAGCSSSTGESPADVRRRQEKTYQRLCLDYQHLPRAESSRRRSP